MSSVIKTIDKKSPLKGKVKPADRLISINGAEINDVIDYKYHSYDESLSLEIETPSGKRRLVKIKKNEGEDLGAAFDTYLMDNVRPCTNKCVFCFVDRLPGGMRDSLYFKDDDVRLSFLSGNYVTLTNLSESDIQRICDLKLSPLKISVHSTDPALRARMLGNKNGAAGLEIMRRFAAAGIVMDCQIVCCFGLNDGLMLQKSMEDLAELAPGVGSVSIVPAGITKFGNERFPLMPFDRRSAKSVVCAAENFSEECLKKFGSRIFFCSDEFYLTAGLKIPPDEFYEEYRQLENGVGLLRSFETEFTDELDLTDPEDGDDRSFCVATGAAAAESLRNLILTASGKCGKIHGKVFAVRNDFFGESVDVAGLVTGGDLIAQLKDRHTGERLIIPQTMLRHGEGVFLDDMTLKEAEHVLGIPIQVAAPRGDVFLRAILGDRSLFDN